MTNAQAKLVSVEDRKKIFLELKLAMRRTIRKGAIFEISLKYNLSPRTLERYLVKFAKAGRSFRQDRRVS